MHVHIVCWRAAFAARAAARPRVDWDW